MKQIPGNSCPSTGVPVPPKEHEGQIAMYIATTLCILLACSPLRFLVPHSHLRTCSVD
ncbi:hypothetical protein CC78DRAFT_531865 [Lojkania enalia]|uniref:Uncharacterized protein n=1 Tax=Lojkania enalia TaxID=147567 RepID=A0A9P4KCL4_9PLEO|nr:hypothetical protein CC78DRAFT_531865 [Didymosphaeria enalia]